MASKSLIACRTTRLNVWALGKLAHGRREFPNAMSPSNKPHVKRCMKAGLVEVVPARQMYRAIERRDHADLVHKASATILRLTDAGFAAIVDAIATDPNGNRFEIPDGEFDHEIWG